jgi:hypothetical protein
MLIHPQRSSTRAGRRVKMGMAYPRILTGPTPNRYRSGLTQRVLQGRSSTELIGKSVRLGSSDPGKSGTAPATVDERRIDCVNPFCRTGQIATALQAWEGGPSGATPLMSPETGLL